jgi:hypothetical protein
MNNTNEMVMEPVSQTATIGETAEKGQAEHPSEGVRLYQSLMLDELPGAVFAAVTLGWIITSFGHLAL